MCKFLILGILFFSSVDLLSQKNEQLNGNGTHLSIECHYKDSIFYEGVYLAETGKSYFYSGPTKSTVKTDISSETAIVDSITNIVTSDFIQKTSDCCEKYKCPDTDCGYFFYIVENGKTTSFSALDKDFATKERCGSDEINTLVRILNRLMVTYGHAK